MKMRKLQRLKLFVLPVLVLAVLAWLCRHLSTSRSCAQARSAKGSFQIQKAVKFTDLGIFQSEWVSEVRFATLISAANYF